MPERAAVPVGAKHSRFSQATNSVRRPPAYYLTAGKATPAPQNPSSWTRCCTWGIRWRLRRRRRRTIRRWRTGGPDSKVQNL